MKALIHVDVEKTPNIADPGCGDLCMVARKIVKSVYFCGILIYRHITKIPPKRTDFVKHKN